MRAKIQGLSQVSERVPLVEGLYRARVVRFEFAGHSAKPCRAATFLLLDPPRYVGRYVRTRLYLHERALWKLRWFLTDFGYDSDLFNADELDDRRVIGLACNRSGRSDSSGPLGNKRPQAFGCGGVCRD